jgi:hypothetical protein
MTEFKSHHEALAAALALCAVVPSDSAAADVQTMAEKIAAGMPRETVDLVGDVVAATLNVLVDTCKK